jgi:hypothetical protein
VGEYFHLVNPGKRQFVHAGLGEWTDKIHGKPTSAESRALVFLACRAGFFAGAPLAGAWARDKVLVVGDEGARPPSGPDIPLEPTLGWYREASAHYVDVSATALANVQAAGASDRWQRLERQPRNLTERRRLERWDARYGMLHRPPAPAQELPLARATFADPRNVLFVNPAKWQFVAPAVFSDKGVLDAQYGGPDALAFLVCFSSVLSGCDLAGTWSGDPVLIVRRDGAHEPEDSDLDVRPTPGQSWFDAAMSSFEDVSYRAMALLAETVADAARVYGENAARHDELLVHVGNTVATVGSKVLERELEERLGQGWPGIYRRALHRTQDAKRELDVPVVAGAMSAKD